MTLTTGTRTDVAYYTDIGYLEKIHWQDGTELYCRKCDAKMPFHEAFRYINGQRTTMLEDEHGHGLHPAQAVATGELA